MEQSNLRPFLRNNLDILFVGLNPAKGSSDNRHYFSVNQAFWNQLYDAGLITKKVDKSYADTVIFGSYKHNFNSWSYGITDLIFEIAESNSTLIKPNNDHAERLIETVQEYEPLVIILLHGKVLDTVLKYLGGQIPSANSGELGELIPACSSNFFNIAFPHGNTITSSDKIKRYKEVKEYLLKLKSN